MEVAAFRRPRVWLVLGLTMGGFAVLFAVYSYVSPILTELGGISEGESRRAGDLGLPGPGAGGRRGPAGLSGAVAFSLGPTVQNGVIEAAEIDGGSLVSAADQGGFNVANALGPALGALVISGGLGYTGPMRVGAALAAVGAGVATAAHLTTRRAVPGGPVAAHPGAVDRLPEAA